jgi:hypothetical protein
MTSEVYQIDGGYGFRILNSGTAIFIQETKPEVEGNILMTETEATEYASQYLSIYNVSNE